MPTSKNKGKQISVIIAGATGSTGRQVVSRLVSHPDVSRVVALVRHPVPVNRWTTVFPQLNTSDALRCLSVVPLDWEKVINDVSKVPVSYVVDGIWDYNAESGVRSGRHMHMSWHQYQQLRRLRSGSDPSVAGRKGGDAHGTSVWSYLFGGGNPRASSAHARHRGNRKSAFSPFSSASYGKGRDGTNGGSAAPQKRVGYVQFNSYLSLTRAAGSDAKAEDGDAVEEVDIMKVGTGNIGILGLHKSSSKAPHASASASSPFSSASTSAHKNWSGPLEDPFYGPISDEDRIRYGKAFLQQMLQTPFYQTVFTGHHVAINCIGTSHWLSSRYLAAVDYDLSIAFAKAVRIFNCMTHAEVNEVEDEILVEQANNTMDSVLWKEIYAACYGKRIESALPHGAGVSGEAAGSDNRVSASGSASGGGDADAQMMSNGGLGPSDTIPGFEMSEEVMLDGSAVPDPLAVPESSVASVMPQLSVVPTPSRATLGTTENSSDREFMRNLTTYGAVATLRHFTQMSVRSANPNSLLPYLYVHGQRDKELLCMFNQTPPRPARMGLLRPLFAFMDPLFNPAEADRSHSTPRGPLASRLHMFFFGGGADTYEKRKLRQQAEEQADMSDSEKVAVERLQLLLRRDRVKVWELADLTIWRPGVFHRRTKQRWLERLFTLVERPVDVNLLAECVVDDIIEGIGREREAGAAHKGTVKVISGQSVSRRVHMKAIEDGLDERDAKHGPNLGREPLLRLPVRIALVAAATLGVWLTYVAYHVSGGNEPAVLKWMQWS